MRLKSVKIWGFKNFYYLSCFAWSLSLIDNQLGCVWKIISDKEKLCLIIIFKPINYYTNFCLLKHDLYTYITIYLVTINNIQFLLGSSW